MAKIRTRIAPSPTGFLHVGTARAALFNELFARGQGGQFIVRIEDTDKERSKVKYEETILEGMRWLGLTWEEGPDVGGEFGPYRQSERTEIYQTAIKKLLDSGAAYQEEGGEAPRRSGQSSAGQAVRLKVEPQVVTFEDIIRGTVAIHTDTWGGDFVIARSLTDPVFHLAVVVDDAAMKITHVIRGEDHLTNTGRHILLQRALDLSQPQYAHLPLLLDTQRRKLSKRVGEVSLLAYRDKGYLPEAMLNYLALLGWNPKDDSEFFTHEELIKRFSLAGVQKAGAIFSEEKLQAVNKHYLRQLSAADFLKRARPFLEKAGYVLDDTAYWAAAAALEQERVGTLGELPEKLVYFKADWPAVYPAEQLVWKKSTPEATREIVGKLMAFLSKVPEEDFTKEKLEKLLLDWIDGGVLGGRGDVLWPMRFALTGLPQSPGPFEVAAVLKKEIVITRLRLAAEKIA